MRQDKVRLLILYNAVTIIITPPLEYHNKVLTRLFLGKPRYGCAFLAFLIFTLGIYRDSLFEKALRSQPTLDIFITPPIQLLAVVFFLTGNVLVLTSMWALGFTGTYLGDYFGILMDEKVTSFPFNVTDAPMYYGSTLSFLGTALWFGKPAGVLLTVEVLLVYLAALRFEEYVFPCFFVLYP